MRNETIHRCSKCGIAPVYQTARITEPLDDVPSILFRLQCPNCGRYGAFCTTKQAAVGYWNREPFTPPRGRKKMTPDQLMGFAALIVVALYVYHLTITPKL